jgi:murein DD-endopeptidase MepM/ murein hydrolase activator NlpD
MPKDDRYYTFLFTRSSKSEIHIRRIEFSKRNFQLFACSLFVILGLGALGVVQYAGPALFPTVNAQIREENERLKNEFEEYKKQHNEQTIARVNPAESTEPAAKDFTDQLVRPGTGGPDGSFQLSQQSEDKEEVIQQELSAIEKTAGWGASSPSAWPHLGKINNEFGFRRNPFGGRTYEFHPGLDIDGEQGQIAYAAGNGTIIKAGRQGGYGNMIEIDHGNGITSRYGHLSRIDVQIGEQITRGQQIGAIGTTGRSTGPHLHFEVRYNDEALNPRRFLPPEPATNPLDPQQK